MKPDQRPAPCYRDRDNGVYFTKAQHAATCSDPECKGCKTCPGRHCAAKKSCSWHIDAHELTCGRCIADVRRELSWIAALSALMPVQATNDGIESEALNLAAPAADPRGLSELRAAQRRHLDAFEALGRITEAEHLHALETMPDDDPLHPYAVTTRWQVMLAEDYDHDLPQRLTTTGAIAYLGRNLHRFAHDDEQDFPLLRKELRHCRKHLESVLHNDQRRDRGAPCPECRDNDRGVVRLERHYAERWESLAVKDDRWKCPRCRSEWSHAWYEGYIAERRGA